MLELQEIILISMIGLKDKIISCCVFLQKIIEIIDLFEKAENTAVEYDQEEVIESEDEEYNVKMREKKRLKMMVKRRIELKGCVDKI